MKHYIEDKSNSYVVASSLGKIAQEDLAYDSKCPAMALFYGHGLVNRS